MIPIRLKIQGLYSYQGPQEIDFEPLLEAGLFGIFGGVGSGKSTILEAMTFALFSQTDRLNQRGDDRLYNMMNLHSSDFLIDFECYAGAEGDKYRFMVKAQRNKKRFMEVPKMDRFIYRWFEGAWRPMPETISGEQIIGLSYDNFRRTIIIPQGRFQDFIELKGQERTEMMKEIFQLEKFDLSSAVGKLLRETKQKLDVLSGQLVGLDDVRIERLEDLVHAEKMQRDRLASLTQEYQQLQLVQETLSALNEWKVREEVLNEREKVLQNEAASMDTLRQHLHDFDHVQTHYQKAKIEYEASQARHQDWSRNRQQAEKEADEAQRYLAGLQKQQEAWQGRLGQLDQLRADLTRWQGEEKLLGIQEGIQGILAKKAKLDLEFQDRIREEKQYVDQKALLSQQVERWQQQLRPDFHIVSTQVREWHQTQKMQVQQKKELKVEADRIQDLAAAATNRIVEAEARLAHFGLDVEARYLKERKKWEEAATQWHVHQSWTHLVTHLADGSPCPVCGSLDHPAPPVHSTEQETPFALDEIQKKLQVVEVRYNEYKQWEQKVAIEKAALAPLADQRASVIARWELNKSQIQAHEVAFPVQESAWRDEAIFRAWETEQQAIRRQQDQALSTMRQLEQQLAVVQQRKRESEMLLVDIEKQAHAQQVLWQAQRDQLAQVPEATSVVEAQQRQRAIQQTILTEEEAFKAFERTHQQAVERSQSTQQSMQQWQQLEVQEAAALTKAKEILDQQCSLDPVVGTWDQMTFLLSLFDAQTLPLARKRLAEYEQARTKWEEAKAQWLMQGKQFDGLAYDAGQHALTQQALQDLQAQLDEHKNQLGALQQQRADVERKLNEKSALIEQQVRLDQRKSELETIDRLFRGQGFVNFVSRIFLEQLCAVANQRFERMTRGQLQLKMGPENTFWVIDRLHGGKERLLKTLSGGQKFQASLALALALADGIQQRLRLDQHFFFIDEGFGSLDKDSLQVVFETLMSLRQEKRCVGVISHVEELQQEIQTYLHIKRLDSGSQITKSWEI